MHNWWIAALEHFGVITREEAEHISNNIKNSIHKENYKETFNELEAIFRDYDSDDKPIVSQLRDDVDELKADKPIANKKKA